MEGVDFQGFATAEQIVPCPIRILTMMHVMASDASVASSKYSSVLLFTNQSQDDDSMFGSPNVSGV
jgi:hypothetical protein